MFTLSMTSHRFKALIFSLTASFTLCATPVWANEAQQFFEKIQAHYESTRSITKFSLNYHFLNKQYRSHNFWDYQTPNRVLSVRMVEVDMDKKHFYDNDILYTAGGQILDRAQFQNDTHSYYYENNGNYLGKQFFNEGMGNFDRFMSYNIMNIDFLAVRPLLEEENVSENISLRKDKQAGTTILTHKKGDEQVIEYAFQDAPLQLVSLHNITRQALYIYDDYQTTRGLTFARSVNKFYNGSAVPAYISFNDKFAIIDEVDASKLKLPPGYGPEFKPGDGVLTATEIGKDLYLVTDSSAWRNSVFKVNGNTVTVFGGAGYTSLAEKTITLIQDKFPDKKITAVHITHPQAADIAGIMPYVELGADILADDYTIAAIKAFPKFAESISKFTFRTITSGEIIDGTHFYVLENLHAKRQSFAYFEDSGILFQADFLNIATDNTIPKVIPTYTRTFIDFVRSKQLNIKRIVSNYKNNNITVEVMNKTYDALM
ncbi:hypothetical protein ACFSJY_13050 [Thalassotalea euphylliae]|uniref:hypothetical protein n=1 Tax=Thalassotalea euphylliae TaxID=1655234 RepID=UPI0036376439